MSDTHPLTFLGVAIAGGGWLFLMLGRSGGESSGREIYNIHLGVIAKNVIHHGCGRNLPRHSKCRTPDSLFHP